MPRGHGTLTRQSTQSALLIQQGGSAQSTHIKKQRRFVLCSNFSKGFNCRL